MAVFRFGCLDLFSCNLSYYQEFKKKPEHCTLASKHAGEVQKSKGL